MLLRGALGAQAANAAALVTATVANTAANRRLTFGLGASRHGWRSQGEGLALLGVGLGLTSGALALLDVAVPGASRATEVAVLVAANALATLVRFVLFRLGLQPAATSDPRPTATDRSTRMSTTLADPRTAAPPPARPTSSRVPYAMASPHAPRAGGSGCPSCSP